MRERLDSLNQAVGALRHIFSAGQVASCLLHGEIRLRNRQETVVASRLQGGIARLDHSARGQRFKDRVADGKHCVRTGSDHEGLFGHGSNIPLHVLDLSVVTRIVRTDHNGWEPQQVGLRQLRGGHLNLLRSDRDVDRLHARELEGRG